MIFELAAKGDSHYKIIQELYDNKIPTPNEHKAKNNISRSSCVWGQTSIANILTDERYTGMYISGRYTATQIGGKGITKKDESEWVKIPNHHHAIISKDLFDKVQSLRTLKQSNFKPCDYPLLRLPSPLRPLPRPPRLL